MISADTKSVLTEVHVGLVHSPVFDRKKNIVATNITNFDVHDIARVCRCYGVTSYNLIHPSEEQLMFVQRLKDHWLTGYGKQFNPLRSEALKFVQTATSIANLVKRHEIDLVYSTSARVHEDYPLVSFQDLKAQIASSKGLKILLLFGTGFGLSEQIYKVSDAIIEPIRGSQRTDFKHLSVRSAVGIALDRLVGS